MLIPALAVGCVGGATGPGAIEPTILAVQALGLECGGGVKDNVPSGLSQWSCDGTVDGEHVTILVDGNDDGVAGITVGLSGSTDPALAWHMFERVVDAVPPLTNAPGLKDAVPGWDGSQRSHVVGGLRVNAMCDESQCDISVVNADSPLRPLPLP